MKILLIDPTLWSKLTEKHVLGRCIAYTYLIEFQKRRLPHAHILIWIHNDDKVRNGDDVDKHVSAEIPDKNMDPKLYSIIKKFMILGHVVIKIQARLIWKVMFVQKNFPRIM